MNEQVKFGTSSVYDLVPAGASMGQAGAHIVFLPGTKTYEEIEADLTQNANRICILSADGETIQARNGYIYAGMAKVLEYVIGTEQVQTGTDPDTGEPVTETRDITGTVMIADFRVPGVQEKVEQNRADIDFLAVMTGTNL